MRWIVKYLLMLGLIGHGFVLCLAQSQVNTLTTHETAQGWRMLFDGKDLAGWQPLTTDPASAMTGDWTVAGGSLVCPGSSAGWLASEQPYRNFELKLQFRGDEHVNSGVFLRSAIEGLPHETGYELQIWDYQPYGYPTGSLVGSLKAAPVKILGQQWNQYDIKAVGDHFVVILNGKTILDGHDRLHAQGRIGFQCQAANRIEFRNVMLLPLPESK